MTDKTHSIDNRFLELLDRLGRLQGSENREDDLNPVQRSALVYLGRANRFSRSPSHVADYLTVTRGTVSQTLKVLVRKGLIEEMRSPEDRRSISYSLTGRGQRTADAVHSIHRVFAGLPTDQKSVLVEGLEAVLRGVLHARDERQFGVCRQCRHHKTVDGGLHCVLLDVALKPEEADEICHEYSEAA